VAGVQLGESIAVYGIGGVGLPLIQLGLARGARVLAVGRSPGKLALARELGAEVVDASSGDPVLDVRRLTRGEGVHVVFDLVGSDESMPAALQMLRRQGRLVFVGYGSARFQLNPLQLVLRETRLVSSLGNTRAELREVVRLAAAGALRVPIAASYALEDVGQALESLRAGQVVGRAVVVPALAPRHVEAKETASPSKVPVILRNEGSASRLTPGVAHPARAQDDTHPGENGAPPLETELLALVDRGLNAPRDDAEFNALALRLFAYQFANNRPYRLLCERRGRIPASISHWREIPPVPIAAFKETLLAAEPTDGAVEFNSSGTTLPERKSRHFHPSLRLYDRNAELNFKGHVLPDCEQLQLLVLFPPRDELPNSSLAHWLTLMVERFGAPGSAWFVGNAAGLDSPGLMNTLRQTTEPVGLLAASFGLVHFLEYCQQTGQRLALPPGSRVMDTGGYKGRSRDYPKAELYGMVTDLLGVLPTHIVNMYGMTEHGTQFLDGVLRNHHDQPEIDADRYKVVPPWARTLVVDPETLAEKPPGERGLLLHVDLINRASALAVLSEDVGHTLGEGFEVLGRAQGSEARGCSIALDELLAAVHAGSGR
jgi:hypothetical protein